MKEKMSYEEDDGDKIIIHLGRQVSEEMQDQIVKDIIKLLDMKYPVNATWRLES